MDQGGSAPVFAASVQVDGDHLRVVVTGEVDMATADTMLQIALREPARRLTLDLRAVAFFDSAAIHAVVRIAERFPGTLAVLPSRQVRRVLEISGLAGQDWFDPS
ncbi:STAS domain-containing protein [Micromonospora inyonensis]|uniref:STAS domain-containing protein n=1 Tax=Micromonospora inyonensis TaxID=47866 RepID=UPI001FDF50E8|nr:STAS domain-containing protein [Micromonospora inyonensis]